MSRIVFLFLMVFTIISCESGSKTEKEIEKVKVDFDVVRFDRKFAKATPESLPGLQQEYPFLFPRQYPDSVWIQKLNDTIQQEINTEVAKTFPDFSEETDDLHQLFQHIKYYFPEFEAPKVITITSEVDYKNKALLSNGYLFIALDTYLGEDHKFYIGIQEFLKKNFRKEHIVVDVAGEYAERYVPKAEGRTFLSHMVYYGKLLYLKELWLPFKSDAEKMGYTREELEWAQANEEQMWRYFVENEMIFDTDSELYSRFLYPAPFSKFYLVLDSESPDRVGQYVGWKMVSAYMKKNDVSIKKMLETDAETIFNNANYKPKK
ncbi:gliding motility lipoprotein GldB [Salegentibacter chungangensis]|uniref:Gliding motility lipoprotein GldB n=1 Tax=Salegentibacter chungangensis TaxID=1335724 RepID=A0ABW3NUB7_9FLAO